MLIGDDTELHILLLIYHTNLKSHDLFFHPEKSTKEVHIWNIKVLNRSWVQVCPLTSSSCMRSLGVKRIPPLWHWERSRLQETQCRFWHHLASFGKLQCYIPSVSTVDVVAVGKNTLVRLYNGKPGRRHRAYHLPRLQTITMSLYTIRWSSGREPYMTFSHKTEREWCDAFPCPNWLTTSSAGTPAGHQMQLHELHMQDHTIERCPVACNNYKGTGSTKLCIMKVCRLDAYFLWNAYRQ